MVVKGGIGVLMSVLLLVAVAPVVTQGAQQSLRLVTASGTGFIVGEDGYVLTNEHIVREVTDISVAVAGVDCPARVIEREAGLDLALLKVPRSGLPVVLLGDSDTVRIGDSVVAIGCPDGRCGTVTVGRVANLRQTATFRGGVVLRNLIMIDVTIGPGSSGGTLLNVKGEVVGITMGGMPDARFGFAIPINDAISLLERVPGFSRLRMGQAAESLTLAEITVRVSPAVVYVGTKSTIPMNRLLLPGEELKRVVTSMSRAPGSVSPVCPAGGWGYTWRQPSAYQEIAEAGCGWYCQGIWDCGSPAAAVRVESTMHALFQADFSGGTGMSYGVPRCSPGYIPTLLRGSVAHLTETTGNISGYRFRFSLITGAKWDWSCPFPAFPALFCTDKDVQECSNSAKAQDLKAVGGLMTWRVKELLFFVAYIGDWGFGFFDGVDTATRTLTALAQAVLLHVLEVLQNP